jgi:hypothetical protein
MSKQIVPGPPDPAFDLRLIRKDLIQFCAGLPAYFREGGLTGDTASVALALGKCFCWIDHRFSKYDRPRWVMDAHDGRYGPEINVGSIGQELWELGKLAAEKAQAQAGLELEVARLRYRIRSLECIVFQMGGVA